MEKKLIHPIWGLMWAKTWPKWQLAMWEESVKTKGTSPSMGVEGHTCLTNRWIALWSGACIVPKDRGTNRKEGRCALFLLPGPALYPPATSTSHGCRHEETWVWTGKPEKQKREPINFNGLWNTESSEVDVLYMSLSTSLLTLSLSFWVIWVSAVGSRHDHARSGLEDRSRRIVHRPAVQ